MNSNRIRICEFKNQCQIEGCSNLHSFDQNYFYKVQMEKAKHQIKCEKNCVDFESCLDLHENERLFIQCQKNCQDPQCIFTHETNVLQNEEKIQKANEYREQGNELYKQGDYQKAIQAFDEAIKYNNTMSVFYSNKALCYKKLKDWSKVNEISKQALQIDEYNLRAKYLETISSIELQKTEPNSSILVILRNNLQILQFIELEAENKQMQSLVNLSKEKNKISIIIEQLNKSEEDLKIIKFVENSEISEQQKQNLISFIWSKIVPQQVFLQKPEPEEEAHDYLNCPITFENFIDPVLTCGGQTYERQALEYHTTKNGYFDPCTRMALKPNYISNLQIQQAVQDFQNRNKFHLQTNEAISFE
ncbi:unnamed protein product [Paramecium sonneborni]|uniref:RING-type E3 ubiquitin transferase n=1 Tax=Paramecium sonneborni TaxID=65129 RepID=A0A8S1PJV9_9CILI|nr:unnamed protein product [Paramecium sonneborni]